MSAVASAQGLALERRSMERLRFAGGPRTRPSFHPTCGWVDRRSATRTCYLLTDSPSRTQRQQLGGACRRPPCPPPCFRREPCPRARSSLRLRWPEANIAARGETLTIMSCRTSSSAFPTCKRRTWLLLEQRPLAPLLSPCVAT